ncbi:hypothetical protein DFP72DRAFT_820994 [Ephemerocybe angulata]|uniref:Endonuclease/exonuclease/phosphatase domain-containing protein n=1 Tax=Ephemerocybe angulata TaxID=980116 RepID=A0A8H6M0T0_9AGAR|nr:hypothetical protein DFP72DRAFT_820994 [Tulosesus angulatus]
MTFLCKKCFSSWDEGRGEGGIVIKMEVDSVFHMGLPSRYRRDVLCVNIHHPAATPDAILCLLNVHMDWSCDMQQFQMLVLAGLLRGDPRCGGGVIAGNFNATHPSDHRLIDKYRLVDTWAVLHRSDDGGATWSIYRQSEPHRLDKVVLLGLQPNEIEVLRPGFINGTPWSDHCGLYCTFSI